MPIQTPGRRRHEGADLRSGEQSPCEFVGSWRWKAPRLLEEARLFAGPGGNESLGRFVRTREFSSPSFEEPMTHARGARTNGEEGNFWPTVLHPQAGGKVPRSTLFDSCSPALSSNGPRRKRWPGRVVARKRRRGWGIAFEFAVFVECLLLHDLRMRKGCRGPCS